MEADIKGHQRKVMKSRVRPARLAWGPEGIPLRAGKTLPFVVEREWNAPAGHYAEQWFLIDPSSREVLFESANGEVLIWGLQSLTLVDTEVAEPISLEPGSYQIVFALDGVMGATLDVEAREVSAEEAA